MGYGKYVYSEVFPHSETKNKTVSSLRGEIKGLWVIYHFTFIYSLRTCNMYHPLRVVVGCTELHL